MIQFQKYWVLVRKNMSAKHLPLMNIQYFVHAAYMWHFMDIFVSGIYTAITG